MVGETGMAMNRVSLASAFESHKLVDEIKSPTAVFNARTENVAILRIAKAHMHLRASWIKVSW